LRNDGGLVDALGKRVVGRRANTRIVQSISSGILYANKAIETGRPYPGRAESLRGGARLHVPACIVVAGHHGRPPGVGGGMPSGTWSGIPPHWGAARRSTAR